MFYENVQYFFNKGLKKYRGGYNGYAELEAFGRKEKRENMKKRLKKWSALLLALSLMLPMGITKTANAQEPVKKETPVEVTEGEASQSTVITYYYVNEHGEWVGRDERHAFPKGSTFQAAIDYLAEKAAPDIVYPEVKFQNWTIIGDIDPDRIIGSSFGVIASYDKNVTNVDYYYAGKDGKWTTTKDILITEKGSTYKEVYQQAKQYQMKDGMSGIEFSGWEAFPAFDEEREEVANQYRIMDLSLNATYNGKVAITSTWYYYDKQGFIEPNVEEVLFVDKGTTYEEAYKMLLENKELPEMYDGLRFSNWKYPYQFGEPTDVIASGYVDGHIFAEYENCIVRYLLDDAYRGGNFHTGGFGKFDYIYCQVAEKGETVSIPSSFEGYKNVTWVFRDTEETTFKVEENMLFQGYGDKDDSKPTDPEEPNKPIKPEEPNKPSDPQLPQDVIDSVVDDVKNAPAGEVITIPMDGATVVPKDVLGAAKGKNVELKLDMGEYTWTINGKDIFAEHLKDINLEVKQNSNTIPNKIIQALAGKNPTQQLSLTHNGDFGFKAGLTINVGSQYHGQYGNLFYYDRDGKIVFINSGMIDENGNVTLTFSHASDYVVVMNKQKMSDNDVPKDLRPNTKSDKSPKTGDAGTAATPAVMTVLAMLIFVATVKRDKKRL